MVYDLPGVNMNKLVNF